MQLKHTCVIIKYKILIMIVTTLNFSNAYSFELRDIKAYMSWMYNRYGNFFSKKEIDEKSPAAEEFNVPASIGKRNIIAYDKHLSTHYGLPKPILILNILDNDKYMKIYEQHGGGFCYITFSEYEKGASINGKNTCINNYSKLHDPVALVFNNIQATQIVDPALTIPYKIHLMPKGMDDFQKMITLLLEDKTIRQYVNTFKFISLKARAGIKQNLPYIVVYPKKGARKHHVQALVDRINSIAQKNNIVGENRIPRFNIKLNNLIYYAQGEGHFKAQNMAHGTTEYLQHFDKDKNYAILKSNIVKGRVLDFTLKIQHNLEYNYETEEFLELLKPENIAQGATPLHAVVSKGYLTIIKKYWPNLSSEINRINLRGETPLDVALRYQKNMRCKYVYNNIISYLRAQGGKTARDLKKNFSKKHIKK